MVHAFLSMCDGVRRVSRLRREPVVSVENPRLIPTSPLFQWDVGISVGFSTETTSSLSNPRPRPGVPHHVVNGEDINSRQLKISDFYNAYRVYNPM